MTEPRKSMPLFVETKWIDGNPWQPRVTMDGDQLTELADSIRAKGLLQPPQLRRSPSHPNRYELAFGHRRLEAWKLARPGKPFPCDLVELSDREMAEAAATENAQRLDLNPVERARALKRLIGEFQMTQAEAGKLYGLATQGAVSNVVRLLELPDKILDLVAQGQLLEKQARLLIFISRIDAAQATKIATEFVQELAAGAAMDLQDEVAGFLRKHGQSMGDELWPLDWLPKEMDIRVTIKGQEPFTAPACTGCPFFWKGRYEKFCARPGCFDAKKAAFANQEARRASKRLGIPLIAKGGLGTVFYKGDWGMGREVEALVKKAPPHLRLVPYVGHQDHWNRNRVLGSRWVALASTDEGFIERLKAKQAAEEKRDTYQPPDPAQMARERVERERRYKAGQALVTGAARQLGAVLPAQPKALELMAGLVRAAGGYDFNGVETAVKKTTRVQDKQRLVMQGLLMVTHDVGKFRTPDPAKLRSELAGLATACKVKLAPGWDALPKEEPAPAANGKKPAVKAKAQSRAKVKK